VRTSPMAKAFSKPCWAALVMGLLVLSIVPAVFAQAPPDKRLDELEKQVQSLQQTVDGLRRSLKAAEAQPPRTDRAAEERPAPARNADAASPGTPGSDPIARIREEGLNHSRGDADVELPH